MTDAKDDLDSVAEPAETQGPAVEKPDGEGRPEEAAPATPGGWLRPLVRGLLAVAILGVGGFAAFWFNWTESAASRSGGGEEAGRLVETVTVSRQPAHVTVRAMGTVTAARKVVIRPRVSGKIVRQADAFVPGGRFDAGDLMVQVDRTDYKRTVRQRKSALAKARAQLKIEKGNQVVAQEELKVLEGNIQGANRSLILRKPQMNQARAEIASAKAALDQAKLDLKRTQITAPFDGHIVSRSVNVGSNVSEGDQLATYVGSDRYWVRVSLPLSHLRWIETPSGEGEKGSPATITHPDAWGPDAHRRGRVTRLVGQVQDQTQMAEVIVTVKDPLARQAGAAERKPELVLGTLVDVRIRGQQPSEVLNTPKQRVEVVVLDRSYVRKGDIVWVMNDKDQLERRDVSIVFRGEEHAYVETGLEDGDRVVTTNLGSPVEGMALRTKRTDQGNAGADDA